MAMLSSISFSFALAGEPGSKHISMKRRMSSRSGEYAGLYS